MAMGVIIEIRQFCKKCGQSIENIKHKGKYKRYLDTLFRFISDYDQNEKIYHYRPQTIPDGSDRRQYHCITCYPGKI